jgi:hypothetical protein
MPTPRTFLALLGMGLLAAAACGSDEDPPVDDDGGSGLSGTTGQTCTVADDCFADLLDNDQIPGANQCLDRVEGGYCTHECVDDDDCCAVEGVCPADTEHVCGPFESTGLMLCFISCESADTGSMDADDYCGGFNRDFICRSTGGGSMNRKVCVPGGGTPCDLGDDCNADFPFCCEDSFGVNRCTDVAGADGSICLNPPE